MDFNELVAETIALIKRPDLVDDTKTAVKAATLKLHCSDFYFKDVVELVIQFDAPRYIQTFDPKAISTTYRHPKYMRIWDGEIDGYAGPFIEHIQIEGALNAYKMQKSNVFYLAGRFIQIRTYNELDKILFGYYQYPNIIPEYYSSWIAEEYPYSIVYEAARTLFLTIGFQEQSASMRSLVQEQISALQQTNVDTTPT